MYGNPTLKDGFIQATDIRFDRLTSSVDRIQKGINI